MTSRCQICITVELSNDDLASMLKQNVQMADWLAPPTKSTTDYAVSDSNPTGDRLQLITMRRFIA